MRFIFASSLYFSILSVHQQPSRCLGYVFTVILISAPTLFAHMRFTPKNYHPTLINSLGCLNMGWGAQEGRTKWGWGVDGAAFRRMILYFRRLGVWDRQEKIHVYIYVLNTQGVKVIIFPMNRTPLQSERHRTVEKKLHFTYKMCIHVVLVWELDGICGSTDFDGRTKKLKKKLGSGGGLESHVNQKGL